MTGEQLGGIQHHISTPDDTIAAEFVSGAAGGQRDLVGFPGFQRLTVGNKIAGFICDGDRYIIVGSLYGLRLRLNAGGEPRPCCPGPGKSCTGGFQEVTAQAAAGYFRRLT